MRRLVVPSFVAAVFTLLAAPVAAAEAPEAPPAEAPEASPAGHAAGPTAGSAASPPAAAAATDAAGTGLFATADQCMACHNGLTAPAGDDVSIGSDWRASMMANAARDPYWHAAVRRETLEHPTAAAAIEDECSRCHMPMHSVRAHAMGEQGLVLGHLPLAAAASPHAVLAADGVSCSACHQISATGLGTPESFVGGFVIDTGTPRWQRKPIFGPFDPGAGLGGVMHSSTGFEPVRSAHVQGAELCATCHTLYTHTLGPDGAAIGRLPEQVPYLEWKHSVYSPSEPCQSCHMPEVPDPVAASSVLGEPRPNVSRHVFRGGNFFMPKVFARHADELGVAASGGELAAMSQRTAEHLGSAAAELSVTPQAVIGGRLPVDVQVTNLAGHKLPTAYPSRRAWLQVTVSDSVGETLFESGALLPTGAIVGNDNDEDPTRYEPHRQVVSAPTEVTIYEAILGAPDGTVTTGLLTASKYLKDSRVLPRGFDKASAGPDIAPAGAAVTDLDFVGGSDRVRYVVDVSKGEGTLQVEVVLWYQPIGYRWADNLAAFDAPEPKRFVRYYRGLAGSSAVSLARAEASVAPRVGDPE